MFAGDLGLVSQLGELSPELSIVGGTDCGVVLPQLPVVERAPGTICHAGHVGDDDVNMTLRIERSARIVLEECVDEVSRAHRLTRFGALVSTALGEILLYPFHRGRHGRPVGF